MWHQLVAAVRLLLAARKTIEQQVDDLDPTEEQKKNSSGVMPFTRVLKGADYTSITGAETHLESQVPNPILQGELP